MAGIGETRVTATNALMAVMEEDEKHATELLRTLLPIELYCLKRDLYVLKCLVDGVEIERAPGRDYDERRANWLNGRRQ